MLFNALRALSASRRIVIVTTGNPGGRDGRGFSCLSSPDFSPARSASGKRLVSALSTIWLSVMSTSVLSSGSYWFATHAKELRARHPKLRFTEYLHNHVPDRRFRALLAAREAFDHHVAVSSEVAAALRRAGCRPRAFTKFQTAWIRKPYSRPTQSAARRREPASTSGKSGFCCWWCGRMSEEKRPLAVLDIVDALRRTLRCCSYFGWGRRFRRPRWMPVVCVRDSG